MYGAVVEDTVEGAEVHRSKENKVQKQRMHRQHHRSRPMKEGARTHETETIARQGIQYKQPHNMRKRYVMINTFSLVRKAPSAHKKDKDPRRGAKQSIESSHPPSMKERKEGVS